MCLFPTRCLTQEFGRPKPSSEGDLLLPCGKCTECLKKRSAEWATRARHEISCHKENSFITLTYNQETVPAISEIKLEFQRFIKRLRKYLKRPIRYMVSHEYGSTTFRPHHHAIIFGYDPKNQKPLKTTSRGSQIFRSDELEKLWTLGFSSIGVANEKTAYYIASYALKGKTHTFCDPNSGTDIVVNDCMDASKRPAIGYEYFNRNQDQLVNSGEILPRYYIKKLQLNNPTLHEHYENERCVNFKSRSSHELLAKYTIDLQKTNNNSEFREILEKQDLDNQLETNLKYTRDEYHRKTKKE
nr:MAG: replication initiator protein [Microviridae sp.]